MNLSCRRSTVLMAAILWIALLSLAGCNAHSTTQPTPVSAATMVRATAKPTSSPTPPASAISSSGAQDVKSFTTTGPLVAEQQADVAAERDGRVVRIAVEIGDHVQAGQVLALLDDRALLASYNSQKAHVASLHAQIAEWQAEVKSEQADLRRADIMLAEKIRSQEDWEHVKYKLDEAEAELARYQADEAAGQADLAGANLQLEQSRIVAPFAGVVGRSSVRLTQEVRKDDILFWITAEAPLHVLFTVPESAMAAFSTGAPLELTTADYPQLRQRARIFRVSPVVDPASDSIQVVGSIVHPSPLLKPGMMMQVRLAP